MAALMAEQAREFQPLNLVNAALRTPMRQIARLAG
jgi:hypothetical protein